jgi:hypothetical protein
MRTPWSLGALSLLLTGEAAAQTSYPMITHVAPVAVQRGKTPAQRAVVSLGPHSGPYKGEWARVRR